MLTDLSIRDFVLVDSLEAAFGPGLHVFTGETGAGKSILIDALELALGGRAEAGCIRNGAARAEVSARFDLADAPAARIWLGDQALDDGDECVLRRTVEKDRPSRAWLNGRPVPVQQLRALGTLLVDIHGQHENQSLLRPETQRELLDDYADARALSQRVATEAARIRDIENERAALAAHESGREDRVAFLRFQVEELTALAPAAGEVENLTREHTRLAHADDLRNGIVTAIAGLDEDETALRTCLGRLRQLIAPLTRHDARLAEVTRLLDDADIACNEAASTLRHLHDGLDLDPERLNELEQRLSAFDRTARKHRIPASELPVLLDRLRLELDTLDGFDARLDALTAEIERLTSVWRTHATDLTATRRKAAAKIEKEVNAQLARLGMKGARLRVALTPFEEASVRPQGVEQITYLIRTHADQAEGALARIASGGELSRVSLALQVALARVARVPSLLFDEVDAGIGGPTAETVGRLLRELGEKRQVFVITHLPQVAAAARHHFQVSKETRAGRTRTGLAPIAGEARVAELARMLGGVEMSRETLRLARDMLRDD